MDFLAIDRLSRGQILMVVISDNLFHLVCTVLLKQKIKNYTVLTNNNKRISPPVTKVLLEFLFLTQRSLKRNE